MKPLGAMLSVVLLAGIACRAGNDDDVKHLRDLEASYGERYIFSLKWEEYLVVKAREGYTPSDDEVSEIYERFYSDANGKYYRKTQLIFLNLYDSDGKFKYKLYFDLGSGRLVKSLREEPS